MADPRDKKPPPIPTPTVKGGVKPPSQTGAKAGTLSSSLPSLAEMSTEGLPSVVVDLGGPSQPKLSEDATLILPARQIPVPTAPPPAKSTTRTGPAPSAAPPAKPQAASASAGEATLILERAPEKPATKEVPRRLATDTADDAKTAIGKAAPTIAPPPAKPEPLSLHGKPLPAPKLPSPPVGPPAVTAQTKEAPPTSIPEAPKQPPRPVVPQPPALAKPVPAQPQQAPIGKAIVVPPPKPPTGKSLALPPQPPPTHKQMEQRIRELLHRFDVPALLDALLSMGYREDQIEFMSNPVLTHRAALLEDIEFQRDPPRVLVLTNYGLLGGQGPIPSYFFELLSEQRDSSMTEFLWYFDNALLRQRFAGLLPERDRAIVPDFTEVKQLQLALLQLGAPTGMHWLFRLVYPELPVSVRRSIQKRRVRTSGVQMGEAALGNGCAFGGFTQVPVGGIDVRLVCEDWNTPTGQPWAQVAEQRLNRLIIPSLESSDVYLTVTLLFLDRTSFAKLAPKNYLGYEPIASPPIDDAPPPVQQVILFQGETGRSPH